ncbi:MAG TPA: MaoC/PaaZ C-terminal domain-containing protein, partial [Minicystis sp.]|nr:MaoC/PaaZ C-terminal domain-containing protein [Minicystis sp.]
VGAVYQHPWDVTVDEGMLAFYYASFQDAAPVYASHVAAREVGLRGRPVHPLLLLNIGISFSVHDVSERAIAHLAYIDVRFPDACYPGDTLRARSRVLGVKPVSSGGKGVVHVATEVVNQDERVVCAFERKALVRAGKNDERPLVSNPGAPFSSAGDARAPKEVLDALPSLAPPRAGFPLFYEDLEVGDVFAHEFGRTVSDAEAMQLATLFRNSHPLHTDEVTCRSTSFAKTRVVYGGLVLAWVLALASRDTAGNAIWDLGLDDGAHPSGVLAGDTLYAASRVEAKQARGPNAGAVTLRVVGVKNVPAAALLASGADLFTPELGKHDDRVPEKVVEIQRTLLVRRRREA